MKPSVRIAAVIQGEATVMLDERVIGHVSRRYGTSSAAGWHAYDVRGLQVNRFPSIKRSHAVDELVRITSEQSAIGNLKSAINTEAD